MKVKVNEESGVCGRIRHAKLMSCAPPPEINGAFCWKHFSSLKSQHSLHIPVQR